MSVAPVDFSLAMPVFVQGLVLSLGLIVAIGAQNAFVLRQGLRREHVGSIVLFCALADALLITAGVMGMARALGESPGLARALALAGAVFLTLYGWRALQRARNASRLTASEDGAGLTRGAALAQAAAFTLLNPHVYLDTVLLVGSIGAQQPGQANPRHRGLIQGPVVGGKHAQVLAHVRGKHLLRLAEREHPRSLFRVLLGGPGFSASIGHGLCSSGSGYGAAGWCSGVRCAGRASPPRRCRRGRWHPSWTH